MRVLAVAPGPAYSVQDVHAGWVEALKGLGVQVNEFTLDERLAFYTNAQIDGAHLSTEQACELAVNGLYSACYQVCPDVLLVTSGFFLSTRMLDVIRARGTKIVMLHTEEPYEHDRDVLRAPHVDVNIVNDPTYLDEFGPDAWYQPHCYRPEIHRPGPAVERSDFCFVGTGYPSRVSFFGAVDFTGIDVALGGNWAQLPEGSPLRKFVAHDMTECCDNTAAVELYRGAKVSANLYRQEANTPDLVEGWAIGPREVELAATGTFFLRDPRPESDELLGMLPSFTCPGDFTEKLRWYLAHDTERHDLAAQARAAVQDRTFTNAARRLLAHLG